jgi:hypothetical protein
MDQWTETREELVQLAITTLNIPYHSSIPDYDRNRLYHERYFAYMVITYLGKEIAIHGTSFQKEHLLRMMKSVKYEWDENNQVFSSNENRCLHLTTGHFVWSDEIADIVDETFEIRERINMTPNVDKMSRGLILDIAPAIIQYGDDLQLDRLNEFIDQFVNRDCN